MINSQQVSEKLPKSEWKTADIYWYVWMFFTFLLEWNKMAEFLLLVNSQTPTAHFPLIFLKLCVRYIIWLSLSVLNTHSVFAWCIEHRSVCLFVCLSTRISKYLGAMSGQYERLVYLTKFNEHLSFEYDGRGQKRGGEDTWEDEENDTQGRIVCKIVCKCKLITTEPVDQYTKESNGIALFFIANWLNLKQLTIFALWKVEKLLKHFVYLFTNHNLFIIWQRC